MSAALHPTGDFVVTSSLDATWALYVRSNRTIFYDLKVFNRRAKTWNGWTRYAHFTDYADCVRVWRLLTAVLVVHCRWDLNTAKTFLSVDEPNKSAIHTAQIHPDGLLLGTGSADSMVYIWDIKEAKSVAEFAGHTVCAVVLLAVPDVVCCWSQLRAPTLVSLAPILRSRKYLCARDCRCAIECLAVPNDSNVVFIKCMLTVPCACLVIPHFSVLLTLGTLTPDDPLRAARIIPHLFHTFRYLSPSAH